MAKGGADFQDRKSRVAPLGECRSDQPISIYPTSALLRMPVAFRVDEGLSRRAGIDAPMALGCPIY